MLEFRYSNILGITAIIFMYSSSMPILYIFGIFYFFITYWIDKWLLFRYYKKPVMFDSYLARKSLNWFKYILLLHCLGFLVMFSNSAIIPLLVDSKDDEKSASTISSNESKQTVEASDELEVAIEDLFDGKQT